jgi:hypothetical protein
VLGVIVGATVMCAAPVSLRWLPAQTPSLTVDKANAVIGRPLTPGSVAGVNGHPRPQRSADRINEAFKQATRC